VLAFRPSAMRMQVVLTLDPATIQEVYVITQV
jgi:hypothetical protein